MLDYKHLITLKNNKFYNKKIYVIETYEYLILAWK